MLGALATAGGAIYKYVWRGALMPMWARFGEAVDAATEIRDLIAGDILSRTKQLEDAVKELTHGQTKLLAFMQESVKQRDAQQRENLDATRELSEKIDAKLPEDG